MESLSSIISTSSVSRSQKIFLCLINNSTFRLIFVFVYLFILMGFKFPESGRSWNSATLNISAKRLDSLLNINDNTYSNFMELYGSDFKIGDINNNNYSKILNDEFLINRFFGVTKHIGIIIPIKIKEKLLKEPNLKIRTDDFEYIRDSTTGVPKFTFFNIIKKSFPGSAFDLPEAEKVVFWQHRHYSGWKVFMVEFVLKEKDILEPLKEYFSNKYGDEWIDEYNKWDIINNVDSWKDKDTSVRLIETIFLNKYKASDSKLTLAFLDIERTEHAINYIYTLMKLAPDIRTNHKSSIPKREGHDNSSVKQLK